MKKLTKTENETIYHALSILLDPDLFKKELKKLNKDDWYEVDNLRNKFKEEDESLQESLLKEDEVILHSLDKNEFIVVTIPVKNLLVDKELISFGGKKMVWSYSEHDADEIIRIKNACK